ncbi:fungal-specific transcription factor domain-containing protein [Dactylonectria estremocensis]|uniref:Fungal-specific transcription factor domain-containing protein n=1 Tax=Dactylonectria estremocensis TaxID=1079267 RepID=A0A9P9J468_9HYPO|nr:fungal-specific transcription factor domain-containing protein [Dactylonectria estremocensis]
MAELDLEDFLTDLDSSESEQDALSLPRPASSTQQGDLQSDAKKRIIRRRAHRACLECRKRKVRCDVIVEGQLCTNCRLDGRPCTVSDRRKRSAILPSLSSEQKRDKDPRVSLLLGTKSTIAPNTITVTPSSDEFPLDLDSRRECPSPTPGLNFREPSSFTVSDVDIIFSCHGFLATGSLSHIPVTDFKFLETNGCFHLPARPVLDEFVVEYFRHVHPMLPILDEGAFWNMYLSDGQRDQQAKSMSLFTFRAMLFVSSSFVSRDTTKLLGFKDAFEARSSLYRRAKLLYDFDAISDPIAKAQGALLLTYYCSGREPLANTFWLRIAIQYAQAERAHLYSQSSSLPLEVRQERKRLWWCCIIRDRILPLGVRRSIQISRDTFDFDQEPFVEADLEKEFETSRVYGSETKRNLACVMEAQVNLAIILTDILALVYPINSLDHNSLMAMPTVTKRLRDELIVWETKSEASVLASDSGTAPHPSVFLFWGLTQIYYWSARAALCQYECLALQANCPEPNAPSTRELGNEIHLSVAQISRIVGSFVHQNVAQYLPVSAVAYLALPIILNTIDIRSTRTKNTIKNTQLRLSNHAMQLCREKYTGAHTALNTINRAIASVDIPPSAASATALASLKQSSFSSTEISEQIHSTQLLSTSAEIKDWLTILVKQPRAYLRLAFTVDISLSRGRYVGSEELPRVLLVEDGYYGGLMNVPRPLELPHINHVGQSDMNRVGLVGEEEPRLRLDLDFFDFGGDISPAQTNSMYRSDYRTLSERSWTGAMVEELLEEVGGV